MLAFDCDTIISPPETQLAALVDRPVVPFYNFGDELYQRDCNHALRLSASGRIGSVRTLKAWDSADYCREKLVRAAPL
jgi:hypothetical protein